MAYDDNDTNNDLEYETPGTPEHSRIYDIRYIKKLKDLTAGIDSDEQDELIDELKGISYNPSNSPENDCELNFLKSKNVIRQKSKLDSHTASYLQFQAVESGKSLAEVKREFRKFAKGGNR